MSTFIHRYLRDKFKIIDPTKICAYGWGYGGYLTSILLTKDSKRTFVCYIAVAPIVSFQFYSKSRFTHKILWGFIHKLCHMYLIKVQNFLRVIQTD
jgi:hypothetical protein